MMPFYNAEAFEFLGINYITGHDNVWPLQQRYNGALAAQLGDAMNTFWAESYEASKLAVTRRAQLVVESRARFLCSSIWKLFEGVIQLAFLQKMEWTGLQLKCTV
ncbi:uncharacterized protein GBIM_00738 [Gryllus bimaculatus]|nr:uncharacterized protein GBIM_00738 [Gryllus bimaculatus]